jgi:hypothetical protein
MPEKPKVRPLGPDTAAVAKPALILMSGEERKQIKRLIQLALDEHDLPRFQAGLLKLGFDEGSAQYEKMMQLWDEHTRASRHG